MAPQAGLRLLDSPHAWSAMLSGSAVPFEINRLGPNFKARVAAYRQAAVSIGDYASTPQLLSSTSAAVERASLVKFGIQLAGVCEVQHSSGVRRLGPGDVVLTRADEEVALDFLEPWRMVSVVLPSSMLGTRPVALEDVVIIHGGSGLVRVLATRAASLLVDLQAVGPEHQHLFVDHALTLLRCVAPVQEATSEDDLARRACAYLDAHMDDPHLSPTAVAEALHVSARTLFAAFAGSGTTPMRYLRQRRLEECRQLLAEPRWSHLSVFAVARRCGFTDPASFSRAFRDAFGITPSQARTPSGHAS